VRENPSSDHLSRRVREKNQNKKDKALYFTYLPRCSLRGNTIGTNFGLRVRLVDVIDCAKFYRDRLRGFDSLRGRILIGLRYRRLYRADGRPPVIIIITIIVTVIIFAELQCGCDTVQTSKRRRLSLATSSSQTTDASATTSRSSTSSEGVLFVCLHELLKLSEQLK